MNDISPEAIAAIARRIYSEIPGVNLVPKTETEASAPLSEVPGWPGHLPAAPPTGVSSALPSYTHGPVPGASHLSVPSGGPNGGGLPAPSSSPSVPPAGVPFALPGFTYGPFPGASPEGLGLPTSQPSLPSSTLEGFSLPAASSAPPAPAGGDGLSAFVRGIQSAPVRNERGQCAGRSEDGLLQRLFASKSAPPTGARPLDVVAIRKDFPILNQRVHGQPLAWLDNGATTQKPQSVIDAISNFYENDNSNIHRGAHTLAARATDAFEQARQKVQTFLGASSSKEIIFVRGTTEGINLVAQTYGRKFFQPGDEIILSTLEHHANIVPWQMVAKEKGAVIRVIPVNDRGEVILEEYQALLGPRTRFVSLAHASNSLGTVLPVAEMTQLAKRHNARVLIDGAQSVSHFPVNVQEIGADFFVFSGHKIFGPTGIGAVYATQEVMEIMPPWQGGGSMIKDVTFEETKFSEPPAKFEAGTPNIADAVGLGAALDYVNRLGRPAIAKYEHELLEYATAQLSGIDGLRIIGTAREKVGVISFVLKERRTEDVGRMLDQEGIAVRAGHHCAQPSLRRFGVESTVRPSLSFYNTHEEIDRLTAAILRILRQ